jgi:AcrR family transcriptional regulator
MPRKHVVRGERTTRQGILAAAAERFASASYDDVSLRDLAAAVGVDVAYVHRSFGSKEQLFREVLEAQHVDAEFLQVETQELAASLARGLFKRPYPKGPYEPDPLLIFVHSLTSPTAGRHVGERMLSEFIEPIRQKIDDPKPFRASMIMSLLIGFSILRHLLQLSAVTDLDPTQAEVLIANTIDGIIKLKGYDGADQA